LHAFSRVTFSIFPIFIQFLSVIFACELHFQTQPFLPLLVLQVCVPFQVAARFWPVEVLAPFWLSAQLRLFLFIWQRVHWPQRLFWLSKHRVLLVYLMLFLAVLSIFGSLFPSPL
jgi:hypothetical protein